MRPEPVIDVHTHVVPESFPGLPVLSACTCWPNVRQSSGSTTVFMGERSFRAIDARSWSVEARLSDMTAEGIDAQLLSPMPELLSYWMSDTDCVALCRFVNAHIAGMVRRHPDRLAGLGMVPLQDPDLAAHEMQRVKDECNLSGIEVAATVNGVAIGDARFDPIFEAAQRLDLAIFVHSVRPLHQSALGDGVGVAALFGYPLDIAVAVSSVILNRVLLRFDGLRLGFSHGGGALAAILPRVAQGIRVDRALRDAYQESVAATLRSAYFDVLLYDQALLQAAAGLGIQRWVLGTDYPFALRQPHPLDELPQLGPSATLSRRSLSTSAMSFIGAHARHHFN